MIVSHCHEYMSAVEGALEIARDLCLGFETDISEILPKKMKDASPKAKADHLADRLLFSLASVCSLSPDRLSLAKKWCYTAFLFLLEKCMTADQIFRQFIKICTLEEGVRKIIFKGFAEGDPCVLQDGNPPFAKNDLEMAVLHLLMCNGKHGSGEAALKHLWEICP